MSYTFKQNMLSSSNYSIVMPGIREMEKMAKEIDMELGLKSVTPNQGEKDTPKRKKMRFMLWRDCFINIIYRLVL